ncbi:MAG: hypothetical protein NTX50_30465 [Candidatus Sumerlaeota bacterium]|nr:hypothetical protein [Candidatus Sumerlaeota bacterium]
MPSNLYKSALAQLRPTERKRLADFFSKLKRIRKHSKQPLDGRCIADNIQSESHLVGTESWGNHKAYYRFLRECIPIEGRRKASLGVIRHYDQVCARHKSKGIAVHHLPKPELLRYSYYRKLIEDLLEIMAGKDARVNFQEKRISCSEASEILRRYWNVQKLTSAQKLSRSSPVWATMELSAGADRDDAQFMAEALALPVLLELASSSAQDAVLYEFRYPSKAVRNHRFPTVADAGSYYLFSPSPEIEPSIDRPETCTGWTLPLNGRPSQPELLHDNMPLSMLSKAPRILGEVQKCQNL